MALPEPPYYAVIFSSQRRTAGSDYEQTAEHMLQLARQQPGYLGFETARDADGFGISVSYWRSREDIRLWREVAEHRAAQEKGKQQWYANYEIKVWKVEQAYSFNKN